jgi:hypothetical protein
MSINILWLEIIICLDYRRCNRSSNVWIHKTRYRCDTFTVDQLQSVREHKHILKRSSNRVWIKPMTTYLCFWSASSGNKVSNCFHIDWWSKMVRLSTAGKRNIPWRGYDSNKATVVHVLFPPPTITHRQDRLTETAPHWLLAVISWPCSTCSPSLIVPCILCTYHSHGTFTNALTENDVHLLGGIYEYMNYSCTVVEKTVDSSRSQIHHLDINKYLLTELRINNKYSLFNKRNICHIISELIGKVRRRMFIFVYDIFAVFCRLGERTGL